MDLVFREQEVTTWSFEMLAPDELRPAATTDMEVRLMAPPLPAYMKWLWLGVGGPWSWYDRLSWPENNWQTLSEDSDTQTWVGYTQGTPVGYFELHRDDREVEIVYFGLLPQFIGQGYGGHLLTAACQKAWDLKPERVWVHTCTSDGPHAINNYKARGFKQFAENTQTESVPEPY